MGVRIRRLYSNTAHAAVEVYKEGDDEVGVVPTNDEAVAGVDEGLNSSPGRVWSDNGSLSLAA